MRNSAGPRAVAAAISAAALVLALTVLTTADGGAAPPSAVVNTVSASTSAAAEMAAATARGPAELRIRRLSPAEIGSFRARDRTAPPREFYHGGRLTLRGRATGRATAAIVPGTGAG